MSRTMELTFCKFTAPAFPQFHCLSSSPPKDIPVPKTPPNSFSPCQPSTTTNLSLFSLLRTFSVFNNYKKIQNFMLRKNKLLQQLKKNTQNNWINEIKSNQKNQKQFLVTKDNQHFIAETLNRIGLE